MIPDARTSREETLAYVDRELERHRRGERLESVDHLKERRDQLLREAEGKRA